jgi:hypothetical protein
MLSPTAMRSRPSRTRRWLLLQIRQVFRPKQVLIPGSQEASERMQICTARRRRPARAVRMAQIVEIALMDLGDDGRSGRVHRQTDRARRYRSSTGCRLNGRGWCHAPRRPSSEQTALHARLHHLPPSGVDHALVITITFIPSSRSARRWSPSPAQERSPGQLYPRTHLAELESHPQRFVGAGSRERRAWRRLCSDAAHCGTEPQKQPWDPGYGEQRQRIEAASWETRPLRPNRASCQGDPF